MALPKIAAPLNHEMNPALLWIEVSSTLQLPSFFIVGLPGPEVAEARERVRAAILSSGFEFPRRRVVLNLSPASVPKRGAGLDLAMALAVLTAGQPDRIQDSEKWLAWGELGLGGEVKPAGQLARAVYAAWKNRITRVIVPLFEYPLALQKLKMIEQSCEFGHPPPDVFPAADLKDAWGYLTGEKKQSSERPQVVALDDLPDAARPNALLPISDSLQRILGVAASGSHHLLLLGPKGVGKSHALEWFQTLIPPPSPRCLLERSLLQELKLSRVSSSESTWRRVSTHVRPAALMGSATPSWVRPGEFSLAHGGVLVADELPEWPRDSRESLREPLERGKITLTRVGGNVELPAAFVLAATGNLCPCGGMPLDLPLPEKAKIEVSEGSHTHIPSPCQCTASARLQYANRLSGPILDRIDVAIRMTQSAQTFEGVRSLETQDTLRKKVTQTSALCQKLWAGPPGQMAPEKIEAILDLHPSLQRVRGLAQTQSLRARHKIFRLALTLACWDGLPVPEPEHLLEASLYRSERFGLA